MKIFDVVLGGVVFTADIVASILESGYGASHGKMMRNLDKRIERRESPLDQEIQNIYTTISRLKKSGYFEVVDQKWKVTSSGWMKLDKLKKSNNGLIPMPNYKKEETSIVKVIAFDIPEKFRFARSWLRSALSNLGFVMMQKSVWIGKFKIQPEFLDDIKRLKLEKFIEIITVNKSGNIRKLN